MELLSERAIHSGFFLWGFNSAEPAEPVRLSAKSIPIVIDQGVFGRNPTFNFVKLGCSSRSDKEGFQQRNLPVLVQISIGAGDCFGEILAETRYVLLIATSSGG